MGEFRTAVYSREHRTLIRLWLRSRRKEGALADELPEFGRLVFLGMTPVGAGFLRRCEGNFVMIDSLVTDPEVEPEIRDRGLDVLVGELMKDAQAMGVSKVLGLSIDKNTLSRSVRFGFRTIPHVAIVAAVGSGKAG